MCVIYVVYPFIYWSAFELFLPFVIVSNTTANVCVLQVSEVLAFNSFGHIPFLVSFTGSFSSSQSLNGGPMVHISDLFLLHPHFLVTSLGFELWIIKVLISWPTFPLNSRFVCPNTTPSVISLIGITNFKYPKPKWIFWSKSAFSFPSQTQQLYFLNFPGQNTKSCSWICFLTHASHPNPVVPSKHRQILTFFFYTSLSSSTLPGIFVTAIYLVSQLLPLSSIIYPQHCGQWCF